MVRLNIVQLCALYDGESIDGQHIRQPVLVIAAIEMMK